MEDLEDRIGEILRNRQINIIRDGNLIPSAVLIPLCKKSEEYFVFFTKRPKIMKRHAGQISFPGGLFDNSDKNIKETAIRETFEELGISQHNMKVLGRLDDYATITGYLISPFVGSINPNCILKINSSEIEELITIPLADLLNISPRIEIRTHQGLNYPTYHYDYHEHVIWGATAKILKNFLELTSRLIDN